MEAGAPRRFTPDESAIANLNAPCSIAFTISRAYINFLRVYAHPTPFYAIKINDRE